MTNMGNMGLTKRAGHVNIYPNGGQKQAGCKYLEQVRDNVGWLKAGLTACSHIRAPNLLIDDYSEPLCQPVAYACSSYRDFKNGKCIDCGDDNENCWLVGLSESRPKSPRKQDLEYFYDTDKVEPYCSEWISARLQH